MQQTVDIVRAGPGDTPSVSDVLARAFQHDPVTRWVVPDDARRRACLPSMFAAFVEVYLPYDETYVAGDGLGAALWSPAGSDPFAAEHAEVFGERIAEALGDDAERAGELNGLLEQHHPAAPCAYLQFMGVRPDDQGRGIGSRLLASVLQRCDVSGTPAYLEATSVDNRRLYERHGFDTVDEVTLPQGPALWPMWREPVTSATS